MLMKISHKTIKKIPLEIENIKNYFNYKFQLIDQKISDNHKTLA
jgi:hypothetical protein